MRRPSLFLSNSLYDFLCSWPLDGKERVARQLPGMMHHYRQCAEELQSEQYWEKKMDAVVGDRVNEVPCLHWLTGAFRNGHETLIMNLIIIRKSNNNIITLITIVIWRCCVWPTIYKFQTSQRTILEVWGQVKETRVCSEEKEFIKPVVTDWSFCDSNTNERYSRESLWLWLLGVAPGLPSSSVSQAWPYISRVRSIETQAAFNLCFGWEEGTPRSRMERGVGGFPYQRLWNRDWRHVSWQRFEVHRPLDVWHHNSLVLLYIRYLKLFDPDGLWIWCLLFASIAEIFQDMFRS